MAAKPELAGGWSGAESSNRLLDKWRAGIKGANGTTRVEPPVRIACTPKASRLRFGASVLASDDA
jgi:hypothetical protein